MTLKELLDRWISDKEESLAKNRQTAAFLLQRLRPDFNVDEAVERGWASFSWEKGSDIADIYDLGDDIAINGLMELLEELEEEQPLLAPLLRAEDEK